MAPSARIVVLPGIPLGPPAWGRLVRELADGVPVDVVAWRGLHTADDRDRYDLPSFVDEVRPYLGSDVVLVGHDLGGVVAAMAALDVGVRGVVLTGTALGPYWTAVRATAWPIVERPFYRWWGGQRFLAGGVSGDRERFVAAMGPLVAAIPDLPARMRRLAAEMRPPRGLGDALSRRTPVRLVWGRRDRWYPPVVARAVSRATKAPITWVDGGHYAMWERPGAFAAAADVLRDARSSSGTG